MNTVQPHLNNFLGCMCGAFASFWYLENVHLKKGLAAFRLFSFFISLNFAAIEVVSIYTVLVLLK